MHGRGRRSIVMTLSVCLSLCLAMCLSACGHISGTARVFTKFLCMLPMAVAQSFSGAYLYATYFRFYGCRHVCTLAEATRCRRQAETVRLTRCLGPKTLPASFALGLAINGAWRNRRYTQRPGILLAVGMLNIYNITFAHNVPVYVATRK